MIYFTIDKLSTTPLYRQIIDQVVDMVQTRTIKHMDKLPTEKEFSDIYHVSSFVVKRAYSELRQMGLVFSVKGRGTFISNRLIFEVDLFKSADFIDPSLRGYEYKILSADTLNLKEESYPLLTNPKGDEYIRLSWVTLHHELPIAYMEILIPIEYMDVIRAIVDGKKTLREFYFEHSNGHQFEQNHTLNTANANQHLSNILSIDEHDPITIVQTVVNQGTGYIKTIYPGNYLIIKAV